jgi:hypothetical protein
MRNLFSSLRLSIFGRREKEATDFVMGVVDRAFDMLLINMASNRAALVVDVS